MKKLYTILLGSVSLFSSAQINVNAGFEVDNGGFTNVSFFRSKTTPVCAGSYGLIRNFWSGGTAGSTSYASNGGAITINFRYRTFVYNNNNVGGTMKVEYSKDGGATFTTLETVNLNSLMSCTSWSGLIPQGEVAAGSNFIFRISGAYSSGDYYLILDEISLTQSVTLAVSNNNKKEFEIYPNPAKNEFQISFSGNRDFNVEVFDLSGKQVAKKSAVSSGSKISTQGLQNGVYTVKLVDGNSEQIKKLIIKK